MLIYSLKLYKVMFLIAFRRCCSQRRQSITKTVRIMKLTVVLLLSFCLQLSATGFSQQVTLKGKNVSLKYVFNEIRKQTQYQFLYADEALAGTQTVNASFKKTPLKYVLDECLKKQGLDYTISGKTIIVKKIAAAQYVTIAQPEIAVVEIRGVVTDDKGQPLEGATIIVKGKTTGTQTDAQGMFSIPADIGNTLVISHIGYELKEHKVSGAGFLTFQLQPNITTGESLVVVGYGTQRRENLTGAVSTASTEAISKRQVSNTSVALQGLVPGLMVIQRAGGPNDAAALRIRGYTSLGNVTPLILVDGIEMGIDNIDPSIIESISVLKDAASASIYGNRAAAGVILITTKRGLSEKISVSYSGYAGQQRIIDYPKNVNAIDHMELLSEAQTNVGITPTFSKPFIEDYKANMGKDPDNYPNTDWYKAIMTNSGLMQNHTLSIRGGSQKVKLLGVVGYLDQKGIIENVEKKRYFVRINSDFQASARLKFKMDAHISQTQYQEPTRSSADAFHWAMRIPANKAAILSNGKWGEGWNGDNPVAFTKAGGLSKNSSPSVTLTLGMEYNFADWLLGKFSYSPNYWESYNASQTLSVTSYYPNNSIAFVNPQQNNLWNTFIKNRIDQLNASLHANKSFNGHNFTGLLGFQQEDYRNDGFNGGRKDFVFTQFPVLSGGSTIDQQTYGWASDWALRSFFGRANYDYKGRYLLEANLRYDGSSRFADGHKWGLFPSFSAGWKISDEPFWNIENVQLFKIRASYGKLGNQLIGNYPFASVVALWPSYAFNEKPVNGAAITTLPNTEITWETTAVSNLGVDLKLFRNLNVTFDVFKKLTRDILLQLDVPLVIGMAAPLQNAGVVSNKGWELNMSYINNDHAFKYSINANLSNVINKVEDIKGIKNDGLLVSNEGYSMNSLLVYESQGYITAKDYDAAGKYTGAAQFGNFRIGDIKYKDQNGDGAITSADKIIVGNTIPRFTYGLNTNLSYKGIDFSMLWQGVGKVNGYLYGQSIMPFIEGGTLQEQHKDRWTPETPNAKFPRLTFNEINNTQNSTFWVKNASFLKLRNMQLGYSLPAGITKHLTISNARFYLSGENLLSFNKFWKGFDPEAQVGNGAFYPQVRTLSVGLNLTF